MNNLLVSVSWCVWKRFKPWYPAFTSSAKYLIKEKRITMKNETLDRLTVLRKLAGTLFWQKQRPHSVQSWNGYPLDVGTCSSTWLKKSTCTSKTNQAYHSCKKLQSDSSRIVLPNLDLGRIKYESSTKLLAFRAWSHCNFVNLLVYVSTEKKYNWKKKQAMTRALLCSKDRIRWYVKSSQISWRRD